MVVAGREDAAVGGERIQRKREREKGPCQQERREVRGRECVSSREGGRGRRGERNKSLLVRQKGAAISGQRKEGRWCWQQ